MTTEQSLNESETTYDNIHTSVSVLNGDHGTFEFDVKTNIGYDVGLTVLFELYIEYKMINEQELRDIYYNPSEGYQSAEKLYQKLKQKQME